MHDELEQAAMTAEECVAALRDAVRHPIKSLRSIDVPQTTGIYALYEGDLLLYVGICMVDPTKTTNPNARGLLGRPNTHRSAPQVSRFAMRVMWERCRDAGGRLEDGEAAARGWIERNVSFAAVSTPRDVAQAAERIVLRRGFGDGPPPFN